MRLRPFYVNNIFNCLKRGDRTAQVPIAINGKPALLEAPDLQLILLAERHDAFLALELVDVFDLLLVDAEPGVDQFDVIHSHKYDRAFRQAHHEELLTMLTV